MINYLIEGIIQTIGLDDEEFEQRKNFLNINQYDIDSLKYLKSTISQIHPAIMDSFYEHLEKFAETAKFLDNTEALDRLKKKQSDYLASLLEAEYDWNYAHNRLAVGVVHQYIGLKPQWYIGAYCHYLCQIIENISENENLTDGEIYSFIIAFLKTIFLDIGLVLDAYFGADNKEILSLKQYAENIVCSIPAAIIVLNNNLNVVSANRGTEIFTHAHHDTIVNLPIEKVIPNLGLNNRCFEVLKEGIPQQGILFTRQNDNGETDHFEITIAPMWNVEANEKPEIHGSILILIKDLTTQERLRLATLKADSHVRTIMDNVPDGIITISETGTIESYNLAAEKIFGYSVSEVTGQNIKILMPEPYYSNHDKYLSNYKNSQVKRCMDMGFREVEGKRKDGTTFPMDLSISKIMIDGKYTYAGIIRDTTVQKADRDKMAKLTMAVEQTADSIIITDSSGVIEYTNAGFEETTGFSRSESIGATPAILNSGLHEKAFYQELWETLLSGKTYRNIFINRKKNGELYHEEKTISPLRDETGEIKYFVSSGKDISTRIRSAERYQYLAHHDPLTGLSNRLLFIERLTQAANQSPRTQQQFAILYVDLDRFKNINDTLGHEAGDELLIEISKRLKLMLRESDTISRLSGDEFAVLVQNTSSVNDVTQVAKNLLNSLSEPFIIENRELFMTISIGIAIYPDNGIDPKSLLKNADIAMYKAKSDGRNNFKYYNNEMNALADIKLTLENELRRALEKDQFFIEYQPKVSQKYNRIEGVEALVRWRRNNSTIVLPTEFVPILEDTGLIVNIGAWILKTACHQLKKWRENNTTISQISVNISPRQILDPDFLDLIKSTLTETGLNPASLELEITENLLVENEEFVIEILQKLNKIGVKLAIDDFGTGFASLKYLRIFPVNTLKIDRTFVYNLPADKDNCSLTAAIINMGHSLKLNVIAEGVETVEQYQFLHANGCDSYQGFYFSKPISPDEIETWVANFK